MRVRIVLTVLIALLAVACGDDAGTGIPEGETPPPTAPSAPDESAPTGPGGEPSTGIPSDIPGSTSQCVELGMALSHAGSMGLTGTGTIADSITALQAMASAAPPQVAADLLLVADAFAELSQILAAAGVDLADPSTLSSPAAQQAMQDASDVFDAAGVDEAGERLHDYLSDICS